MQIEKWPYSFNNRQKETNLIVIAAWTKNNQPTPNKRFDEFSLERNEHWTESNNKTYT